MAAVSAADQTGEVPGFADGLGERLVVAQPSGALLEFLVFHPGLSSAPFFEPEVKARLKRLSRFRHAAYARATRLQRDPVRGNRLTLVSAYTPGRRLADILVLARRAKLQPAVGAVLSLARQLMTGTALLHDYAPDVFHGAIGPERFVVASDGRLIITEYVLGTAVERAVAEFGVTRLWRECRLATLADTSLARYGRRLDLLQIGLVTLALLLGRQPSVGDFPARLPDLLDAARETSVAGEAVPLGEPLRDWLARLLLIDASSSFKTLIEAQKAFNRLTEDQARYPVAPEAVEAFLARCEDVATLAISAPPDSGSIRAALEASAETGEAQAGDASPAAGRRARAAEEPVPSSLAGESVAAPVPDIVPPVDREEIQRDAIAEMMAALPKPLESGSAADPFEPFPFVVATEAATELGETARPTTATASEPPVLSAPVVPAAAAAPPARVPAPDIQGEAVPPPPAAAHGEAAPVDWPATPPISDEPHFGDLPIGERKGNVLSYDEVHRAAAPRRPKAPFVWAAAVIVVFAVAGVVGGPRIGTLLKGSGKTTETVRTPPGSTEPGGFKITTQPAGSRITIDGTARGTAPLRVDDLAPGLHSVVVESAWGRLEETVTVDAGKVVPLALATVGWIKVEAPVELEVSEEGRVFGTTGQALMVPAGRHAFIFSNRSVAVRHRQFVQVPAGQTVKVPLDLPQGMLNLTSDQPAQVLVDGESIGDAPQVSVPVSLGPHEIIFRSARYGDVSYSVNVTLAAPLRLTAAFGPRR